MTNPQPPPQILQPERHLNVNDHNIHTPENAATYAQMVTDRRVATQQITPKTSTSEPLNLSKSDQVHRYYIIERNPPDFYFVYFQSLLKSMISCGLTKFRMKDNKLKRCIHIILDKEKSVATFQNDIKLSNVIRFKIGRRELKYEAFDAENLKHQAAWVPRIVKTMTLDYLPACLQDQQELIKDALKEYAEFMDDQSQSHVTNGCYRQKMTLFVKKFMKIPKSNFNLPCTVTEEMSDGTPARIRFDTSDNERAQYEIEISCSGFDGEPGNEPPVERNDPTCVYCMDKGHVVEDCPAVKRREQQRLKFGARSRNEYLCMRCKRPDQGCTREICEWAERMFAGEFPPVYRENRMRLQPNNTNSNTGSNVEPAANDTTNSRNQLQSNRLHL